MGSRTGGGEELIQGALGDLAPRHGLPVAAEGVQSLLEALKGEGLDQVVHHPQLQQLVHCGCVIGGGDHDGVHRNVPAAQGLEKLQTREDGHVDVQHHQVGGVLSQPVQGGLTVLEGLDHPEPGILFGEGAVQEGHHGIVLHDHDTIYHLFTPCSPAGLPGRS